MITPIPTYALYGEYLEESREDILHHERLHDRSAKHDWSIRPHKHDTMWQFFYLKGADVRMQLDKEMIHTTGPVFVIIPPLLIHAFQFPPDTSGSVVSVRSPKVMQLLGDIPESDALGERAIVVPEQSAEFDVLCRIMDNIQAGFGKIDLQRNQYLGACLTTLLITLIRHVLTSRMDHQMQMVPRDDALLRRFCNLVEENYQSNRSSVHYASALGISTVSLNRKCRATLGSSPQRLITKRRILEARRLLQFTQFSVSQIAERLGFSDTSYFCRLFKKETAKSPAAFRRFVARQKV